MKVKICLDLCSGKGGFSQAFLDREDWEVITIDVVKKFKPTIQADICHLPLRENLEPDVMLASPPCNRFSIACPQWPKKGIMDAFKIVGACFEAIAYLKPKRWLIENPRGRLRWFLGKPRQTIRYSDYDFKYMTDKITDFWGNIPFPMVKGQRFTKPGEKGWFNISRNPVERAFIPKGVSEAVYEGNKSLSSTH